MGRPKQELRVGDTTLLRWQIARLRSSFGELVIVGATSDAPDIRIVADERSSAGPLAGIETGLKAMRVCDRGFVLACDMPRVRPALATLLYRLSAGHEAAVPRVDGIAQPTCAVYARSAQPKISAFLDAGHRRVTLALDELDVRYVDEEELRSHGHDAREFTDLDTPADYEAFLSELRS
jgi:molybdopterin-guanine dinucleotide biosynthesis protein A